MNDEQLKQWLKDYKVQKQLDINACIYPPTKEYIKSRIAILPEDLVTEYSKLGDKENARKYYTWIVEAYGDDEIEELYEVYLCIETLINPSALHLKQPPAYELSGLGDSEFEDLISLDDAMEMLKTTPAVSEKVPRNNPCPCGSGKKYKKCCL